MISKRNKSSSPRFNLNYSKDNKSPQLIFLMYRYKKDDNGKHILMKYSTGEKIYAKNWDRKMQIAIQGVRLPEPNANRINNKNSLLKDSCLEIVASNPDISVTDFKLELDYVIGNKRRPKLKEDISLLEYIRIFISKSNRHNRTIAKYEGVYNHICRYEAAIGYKLTFEMVNAELSEKITNWLYKTKSMSQNNVSKIIQTLKQIIRDAHENGYHNNTLYQSRKFSVKRVVTSKHYLEINELEKLANYDFDENEKLNRSRDLWLIAAYTGLRYSDFSRLEKTHFISNSDGSEDIEINTYKGSSTKDDTKVIIPVLPIVKQLVQKYQYEIPKAYSSQKMNKYIKEVCRIVGINRIVQDTKSKGGKLLTIETQLSELVTNHTARYTFINIMLNEYDIPAKDLMKVTGQTLKVLMGYERGDKKKNAAKVRAKTFKAMGEVKLKVI